MQPHSVNRHLAVMGAFNHHPHVAECLQGRQGILPFQEAFYLGHPFCQRTEHDGTVGHGFIAGHAQAAL